jgi:glycosyltransferase involved in cell wall biosynthesis
MKAKRISLIIPVHNEVNIIEEVIKNYHKEVISKIPGSEFIIAEDGSNDGTKEVLRRITEELPITLISSDQKKGYSKAVWDAFKLARNEIIFFSDSDGQHSPGDFWKMVPFIEDFEVINGYKFPRQDTRMRCLISSAMNLIVWVLFGIKLRDINCGFKVMKKEVVDNILKDHIISDFISTELIIRIHKKGYKIVEVPIRHYSRPYGDSHWLTNKKLPKIILKLLVNFLRIKIEFMASDIKRYVVYRRA